MRASEKAGFQNVKNKQTQKCKKQIFHISENLLKNWQTTEHKNTKQ